MKGEVEQVGDEARGQGVEAGFKIFYQLLLQLHPDFDMKALEALVMLEVVGEVVNMVEEEVAAAWKVAGMSGRELQPRQGC